jgi:DNA-directed RNA polymerase subunit L
MYGILLNLEDGEKTPVGKTCNLLDVTWKVERGSKCASQKHTSFVTLKNTFFNAEQVKFAADLKADKIRRDIKQLIETKKRIKNQAYRELDSLLEYSTNSVEKLKALSERIKPINKKLDEFKEQIANEIEVEYENFLTTITYTFVANKPIKYYFYTPYGYSNRFYLHYIWIPPLDIQVQKPIEHRKKTKQTFTITGEEYNLQRCFDKNNEQITQNNNNDDQTHANQDNDVENDIEGGYDNQDDNDSDDAYDYDNRKNQYNDFNNENKSL